jgi:DNA-binding NarL/FixJ family response regulator
MSHREGIVKEANAVRRHAPCGLLVDKFEIGDEELALFEWDIADAGMDQSLAALTKAERSVLGLVATGASNAHIARVRGSSVRTVANQVACLLKKLGAGSRFELVRRYGRSDANGGAT